MKQTPRPQEVLEQLKKEAQEILSTAFSYHHEKKVRQLGDLWKDIKEKNKGLVKDLDQEFKDVINDFYQKWNTQKDEWEWKIWSNTDQLKKILEEAQKLEKANNLHEILKELPKLTNRWKSIKNAHHQERDKLWQEFSSLSQNLYGKGLEKKEQLIEELNSLIKPVLEIEEEISLTKASEIKAQEIINSVKEIQRTWNEIGPIPLPADKKFFKKFKGQTDLFFEKMQTYYDSREMERASNFQLKLNLNNELKKVLKKDSSPFEKAKEVANIQRKWKSLGAAPVSKREDANKLWEEFRGQCNAFFDSLELIKKENLEKKRELVTQLEKVFHKSDLKTSELKESYQSFQKQWNELVGIPRESEKELQQSFQKMQKVYKELLQKKETEKKDLQDNANKQKKEIFTKLLSSKKEELESLKEEFQQLSSTEGSSQLHQCLKLLFDAFMLEMHPQEITPEQEEQALQKREKILLSMDVLNRVYFTELSFDPLPMEVMGEQIKLGQEFKAAIFASKKKDEQLKSYIKLFQKFQNKWKKTNTTNNHPKLWERYLSLHDFAFRHAF